MALPRLLQTAKELFPPKYKYVHLSFVFPTPIIRFCVLSSSAISSRAQRSSLFSTGSAPQTSSFNNLIRAYAAIDSPREAILVYRGMKRQRIPANELTFPLLVKASAALSSLAEGQQVQVDVLKHGLQSDVYVLNTLISFYGSSKNILDARKVFEEMSARTVCSWNAIITACVENSWFNGTLELFDEMKRDGFDPDETTMVLLLSACGELGKLSFGKWVHSQVIVLGMVMNCQLGTALVDMYAKCGALAYANGVFDRMHLRNVRTWSAMILGLAQHGLANDALQLFLRMERSSISPNSVTILGVLCACSHAGLVEDGYKYFHKMETVYKIKPKLAHYGAMVDILGRAGRLEEAYSFIMNMPIEPDSVVWRTLLGACAVHNVNGTTTYQKNVNGTDRVEENVRTKLLELEPRRAENFVMVANMYAESGMWEKATNLRRFMRERGLKKIAGESCVEIEGVTRSFIAGNDCGIGIEGVYQLLDGLNLHMKTTNCP